MRKCAHHGIPPWLKIQTFYGGLLGKIRTILDAVAGGALMWNAENEDISLLDEMTSNSSQWPVERLNPKSVAGMVDVNSFTTLEEKLMHYCWGYQITLMLHL